MLYEQPNQTKINRIEKKTIPINFGKSEIEKLKNKKVVYLFGVTPDWVQHRFIRSPDLGRVLDFAIINFAESFPQIESPFFKSTPIQYFDYYSVAEYYVDPLVSITDYCSLLDNIADELNTKGYLVLKVLKEPKSFQPEFTERIGLEMFLEKPRFVDAFVDQLGTESYFPLDSTPESLFTSAWRFNND